VRQHLLRHLWVYVLIAVMGDVVLLRGVYHAGWTAAWTESQRLCK
jgi:hypothetical protein